MKRQKLAHLYDSQLRSKLIHARLTKVGKEANKVCFRKTVEILRPWQQITDTSFRANFHD